VAALPTSRVPEGKGRTYFLCKGSQPNKDTANAARAKNRTVIQEWREGIKGKGGKEGKEQMLGFSATERDKSLTISGKKVRCGSVRRQKEKTRES